MKLKVVKGDAPLESLILNLRKRGRDGRILQSLFTNCKHMIRINNELQSREYTQLEILLMVNCGRKTYKL